MGKKNLKRRQWLRLNPQSPVWLSLVSHYFLSSSFWFFFYFSTSSSLSSSSSSSFSSDSWQPDQKGFYISYRDTLIVFVIHEMIVMMSMMMMMSRWCLLPTSSLSYWILESDLRSAHRLLLSTEFYIYFGYISCFKSRLSFNLDHLIAGDSDFQTIFSQQPNDRIWFW